MLNSRNLSKPSNVQQAPSYTLKGVLLDSLTQEGEPYATIKIVKKSAPQKP